MRTTDKVGQIVSMIVIAVLIGLLILVVVHLLTDFQIGGNEARGLDEKGGYAHLNVQTSRRAIATAPSWR